MMTRNDISFMENSCVTCRSFIDTVLDWNITKRYAAIMFNANDNSVSLTQWDDFEEFAAYWGTDSNDWLGIDRCNVGETVTDGVEIYLRIK